MRHSTFSYLAIIALIGVYPGTATRAETPIAAPLGPTVVSSPERWLGFYTRAPKPLAVRSDWRRVVVASNCETMLYDLASSTKLHTWSERFESVDFSNDGHFLLTFRRGEAIIWDAETYRPVGRFTGRKTAPGDQPYPPDYPPVIALNANDSQLAISNLAHSFSRESAENTVFVYDVASGAIRQKLPAPTEDRVASLEFSSSGRQILVEYSSTHLSCAWWDTKTGELVRKFSDTGASLSPDGRWVATQQRDDKLAGEGSRIMLWHAATGKAYRTLKNSCCLGDFAFSPDSGKILADCGKRLIEWDVNSGKKLFEGGESDMHYVGVMYSPDGRKRFGITTEDPDVNDTPDHFLVGWTSANGAKLPICDYAFEGYKDPEILVFNPTGDRFINLAADEFAVRDVLTGGTVQTLPADRNEVNEVAFLPDGKRVLIDSFVLTDLVTGKQCEWRPPYGGKLVDNGRLLFNSGGTGTELLDVATKKVVWQFPADVLDAVISPDGRHIAGYLGRDSLEPTPRFVVIDTCNADHSRVLEWAPSAASTRVARDSLGGNLNRMRLLDCVVSAMAFCPDGQRFLAATSDDIYEVDARTCNRTRLFSHLPGRALSIAYSPDASRVLACGVVRRADPSELVNAEQEGWVLLWDRKTGHSKSFEGHTAPVTSAVFSPDGARIATGSLDKTVRLWDSASGQPLCIFRVHKGELSQVAYSPLGDRILTAAEDGAALLNVGKFSVHPVESFPIAATFAKVESVGGAGAASKTKEGPASALLPMPPGNRPASIPVTHDWAVVEIGDCRHERLPADIQALLQHAKIRKHFDLPPSFERTQKHSDEESCGASRDGRRRAYYSQQKGRVVVRDENDKILSKKHIADADYFNETRVLLAPSGRDLLVFRRIDDAERSIGVRREIAVVDATTGSLKRVIHPGDDCEVDAMYLDPKEETILLSVRGCSLVTYDYHTGCKTGEFTHGSDLTQILVAAYSPDGRFLAACSKEGCDVNVYDTATLRLCKTLPNLLPVSKFTFSPDGKRLLVNQDYESGLQLWTMWEVDSARRQWSRFGYREGEPVFSPDGTRFLIRDCMFKNSALLRDANQGDVLCILLGPASNDPRCLVFGSDGGSLHLGSPNGPVLWPKK